MERKIQLELAPPKPDVAEMENEGQQVKPMSDVGKTNPLRTEDVPQIRSPANERSPTSSVIADNIIIGCPGFRVKDENGVKGLKM